MNHSTWQQQKWSLAQVKGESKEEFHFGKEKGSSKRRTQSQGASFPVSKCQVPRACVRRKLPFFFLVFPCNEPKGERQGSVSRFNLKSLVSPTARVKGESKDYVQPGLTCQRSPSRRKGE
nr:hypothetical protein [Nicotiana tabacum]UYX57622.1 hypothetical protein [Nicotiana tabacum]